MGVSIFYRTPRGKEVNVTPGWRSKMYGLLRDEGLLGDLTERDIPDLVRIARHQRREDDPKPFDWSYDIGFNVLKICRAIKRYGYVTVYGQF